MIAAESQKLGVMKALIEAWTQGDVEGALSHMTDDIVWHYAAGVAPPIKGKAKAKTFLEGFKAQITAVDWRIFDFAENGDRLFVEGVDEHKTTTGVTIATPYAGVLEFRGDQISAWRDYVDVGVMEAQRGGAPASPWVQGLLARPAL